MSISLIHENREFCNLGGISSLLLVPISNVLSYGDIVKSKLSSLLLESGSLIFPEVIQEQTLFSEEQKLIDWFDYELKFKISKDRVELLASWPEFLAQEFLAIIKDNNDLYRVLGNKNNSLRIFESLKKGSKTSDLNHYTLTSVWSSNSIAPYIESYQIGNNCFLLNGQWTDGLGFGDNCPWNG